MTTALRQVKTLRETMVERGRDTKAYLQLEAACRAAVSEMAPWWHKGLRASEEEWVDHVLSEAGDRAIEAALAAAAEYLSSAIDPDPPHSEFGPVPASLVEHPDSTVLRADQAVIADIVAALEEAWNTP